MKIEYPKEWFEKSAEIEGEAEVGCGTEIPLQFQTCKHGTAFRYDCEECVEECGNLD